MVKTNINWNEECGKRLKEARLKRGLSQGQICENARIPAIRVLSQFESGANSPKMDRLQAICRAIGVDVEYILNGVKKDEVSRHVEEHKKESLLFPGSSVGERLTYIRKKNGLSRSFLSEFVGISSTMLCRYETGKNQLSELRLGDFAALYSCKVGNLVSDEELAEIRRYDRDPGVIQARRAQEIYKEQREAVKAKKEKQAAKAAARKQEKAEKVEKSDLSSKGKDNDPGHDELPVKPAAEPAAEPKNELPESSKPLCGNALEVAFICRTERAAKGIDAKDMAEKAGIPYDRYCAFEAGRQDICLTELFSLCRVLMISPTGLIKRAYTEDWHTFLAENPKELCAAIGACVGNQLEYSWCGEETFHVYGKRDVIEKIFQNLHIAGKFVGD